MENTFFGNSPVYFNEAYDAIENSAGNYYAHVGDTLYEFDPTGNICVTTQPSVEIN
jgi:hypothetical protein